MVKICQKKDPLGTIRGIIDLLPIGEAAFFLSCKNLKGGKIGICIVSKIQFFYKNNEI